MNLSPLPIQKFFDNAGRPLSGGLLFTYIAGTTTKLATYQNQAGTPNTNPIVLDFRGEANVWLDQTLSYKFVLAPANDTDPPTNPIWTVDNISAGITFASLTAQIIGQLLWPRTPGEILAGVTPTNYAYEPYVSKRYGVVSDNTDQRARLQNMLDSAQAAATNLGAGVVAYLSTADQGTIRCDDGLTYDPQKMTLDGCGTLLNFENKTVGAFSGIKLQAAQTDISLASLLHNVRGLRNLYIQMPSYLVNASGIGLDIERTGLGEPNAIHIQGVSINGGAEALRLGNVSYALTIESLVIVPQGGNAIGIGVRVNSTGGNETTKIMSALITGASLFGVQCDEGDCIFMGSNIDGCKTISYQLGTSHLVFSGCYYEFVEGDNTAFKFRVEDTDATLVLADCNLNVRPDALATRTKEIFNVTSGATLILRDVIFRGNNTAWYKGPGGYLVSGVGNVSASGVRWQDISAAPLVHRSLQWMAFPDITDATFLAGNQWTLSNTGAANPARVTGVNDGVQTRDAVRFQINNGAASGSFSRMIYTRTNLIPGRRLTFAGDAYTAGTLGGSNVSFQVTFTFKKADGNTLTGPTTTTVLASVDSNTWAGGTFIVDGGIIPNGASSVDVQVQTIATNTVAGNTQVNVSPIGLGYADGD